MSFQPRQPLDGRAHAGDGDGAAREAGAVVREEDRLGICLVQFRDGTTLDLSGLTIEEAAERTLAAGYTLRDIVVSATSRRATPGGAA